MIILIIMLGGRTMMKQKWLKSGVLSLLTVSVVGMGSVVQAEEIHLPVAQSQSQTVYGQAILGDAKRDTDYVKTGVLVNGVYHFTQKETTIKIDGIADTKEGKRDLVEFDEWFNMRVISAAISGSRPVYDDGGNKIKYDGTIPSNNVLIDLHGNNLKIDAVYNQGDGQTGISAIARLSANPNNGKVEINHAGTMDIRVKGSDMTAGLFVNKGGKLIIHNSGGNEKNKIVTIRGSSKEKNNGVGIKSMNGDAAATSGDNKQSEIIIEGLVDVVADGAYQDGYASNEAVSAVASDITIGGGTIKAIHGAWAAIRAYGEFVTPNYGIVSVNTVNRTYVNETGQAMNKVSDVHKVRDFDIGNHPVIIEGDLVTNGGMGTKGQINVGLSGKESEWHGNYADTVGYGYTPGSFGAVNIKMKDGAHWKGFGNGSMYISMSGHNTYWRGFSIVDKLQLHMKDGATWYNAITPEQTDQKGERKVDAQIASFVSDKGIIDMTGVDVFTATSESLVGKTTADNPSGIVERKNGVTGNVVIGSYSGNSTVIYRHQEHEPTTIIGGDIIIKNAMKGSEIILRTDNNGLNTDSEKAIDKNLVSETLNRLAHKLFYTAYKDGERNLKGYVEIVEGLTSSLVQKKIGDITYTKETGQGNYMFIREHNDMLEQTMTEFSVPITGDVTRDKVYVEANVLHDNVYTFTKPKSNIKVHNTDFEKLGRNEATGAIVSKNDNINVDAGMNDISLDVINTIAGKNALGLFSNKKMNIKVNDLNISTMSSGGGVYGVGLFGGGSIAIDGNVSISSLHHANGFAHGIDLYRGSNFLSITGNLVMKGTDNDLYAIQTKEQNHAVGIYVWGKDQSKVLVDGKSEIYIKGIGVDMRGGGKNIVRLEYGDIITPEDVGEKNYLAGSISSGSFYIGMNQENSESNGKDVRVHGGVYVGEKGKVYMGLGTPNSEFIGLVHKYDPGIVEMCLENGAIWKNRKTSAAWDKFFEKSHLNRLIGGKSATHKGIIFQQNEKDIILDKYSGHTKILYSHELPVDHSGAEIIGGNIVVHHAEKDSVMTISTDNKGLHTDSNDFADKKVVNDTLNNLAKKLFYTGYKDGERNLKGYVEIAEGLTSVSASKRIDNISFNSSTGQGEYQKGISRLFDSTVTKLGALYGALREAEPEIERGREPITKSMTLEKDRKLFMEALSTIGDDDDIVSGIYAQNDNIIINMNDHALDLTVDDSWQSNNAYAIYTFPGTEINKKSIHFTNMKIGKALTVNAITRDVDAYGMYASANSEILVEGDLEIKSVFAIEGPKAVGLGVEGDSGEIHVKGNLKIPGYSENGNEKSGFEGFEKREVIVNNGKNGKLIIDGLADIVLNENLSTDTDFNTVIVASGEDSITRIGGGHIRAEDENSEDKYIYRLIDGQKGTILINMNEDGTLAGDKETVLYGTIFTNQQGTVHIGLSNQNSSWTGLSDYDNAVGALYLHLSKGAFWNNLKTSKISDSFNGSIVRSLTGGSEASDSGVIYQNDENPISIGEYSGHTTVVYKHKTEIPADVKSGFEIVGGEIHIEKAKNGSEISIVTDSEGLTIDPTTEEYKNLLNGTLNGLANKLYYLAYKSGEENLTGYVGIAEGLTSEAVNRVITIKKPGKMTFIKETGQGQYVPSEDNPTPPPEPNPPTPRKPTAEEFFELWKKIPGNENKSLKDFFDSMKGESAYDIWKKQKGNENKSEQDYLNSLKGESAYDIWKRQEGNEGKSEQDYINSLQGKDAFELWKTLPGNENKTKEDFLDSLKGKSAYEVWQSIPGNEGKSEREYINSLKGKSAYEVWKSIPGNEGKSEQDYIDSLQGKSAYDLWKTLPGNANKTKEEYLNSLKSESAYDIWKKQKGNEDKTEQDFIDSLKGKSAFELWKELKGNKDKTLDDFWIFLGRRNDGGDNITGPKETLIMRAAKSAMTTTIFSMRDNMSTMIERMGDLRNDAEDGIWARTYGGKASYDKDNTEFNTTYHGVQIGMDKKLDDGWHTGIAIDYQMGNSTYENGGKGDPKLYTIGFYGTKVEKDGSYVDVIAKVGRGENKYTVYNTSGNYVNADYKANAYGFSVEYGKRMERAGTYIEPQIQLSYMNMQSADYNGNSDYDNGSIFYVKQDGMTSFIGRIGLAVGRRTENTTFYLKAGFLHEFAGDTKSTFGGSAKNQVTKTIAQEFKDTWVEMMLGISYYIGKGKVVYADIARTFGGEYKQEWKVNAGIRMRF